MDGAPTNSLLRAVAHETKRSGPSLCGMPRPIEPERLLHISPGSVTRESYLDDVDSEILARLRPLIRQTLGTGEAVALPFSRWTLAAAEHGERLDGQAWYGPADGEPHLRWTVLNRRPEACLVSAMHGLLRLQTIDAASGALEAGDLARAVAWAWIRGRASD